LSTQTTAATVREITDDEAQIFAEQGWAKLDQLISGEAAADLLAKLQRKMGADGQTTTHPSADRAGGRTSYFNTFSPLSVEVVSGDVLDEDFNAFSHSEAMGRAGAKLCGEPVRFWVDQAMVKTPVAGDAGSGETTWHVDISGFDTTPFGPPSQQVLVWIALNDIPADRGAMRFVAPKDIDDEVNRIIKELPILESYAALEELGVISEPLDLKAGDATVHSGGTLHSAPPNTTSEPRWVYNSIMVPARSTYTGNVFWPNEGIEMAKGELFPDHRFPVLA
jgi:hypothetical protein